MLFCSEKFLVFFTIVFVAYWAMPWRRARTYLLLVASFYFYASWNHWLALIIGVSTTIDYFVARSMDATEVPWRRKALLSVTIVANLGLLCYFKYANFFLQSLEQALQAAGSTASLPVLKVMLPIGISFYTFEAINYAVDVYRKHVPAERNWRTSCCSSRSFHTWSPDRSFALATSCRRSPAKSVGTGPACNWACSSF